MRIQNLGQDKPVDSQHSTIENFGGEMILLARHATVALRSLLILKPFVSCF